MERSLLIAALLAGSQMLRAQTDPCTELFFSEYIEGSGNNKALEIHNPSQMLVDLAGYTVELYSNGSSTPTNTHALSGMLAAFQVVVLANSQADPAILALATATPAVCQFNGDDALVLRKNGVIIDVIGEMGVDPGNSWPVDMGSTQDHTLIRNFAVDGPDDAWSSARLGWTSHPQDHFNGLGGHLSTCHVINGMAVPVRQAGVLAHPSPAAGLLTITRTGPVDGGDVLLVMDAQGRTVRREPMPSTRHLLDVHALPAGVYNYQVAGTHGRTAMGRFVVAR